MIKGWKNNQNGFVLPLTMILSLILLAFVFHALLILNSDRKFYQQSYAQFQLQQLRECALIDFERELASLTEQGTFVYRNGTVQFNITEIEDHVIIRFTLITDDRKEIDQMTYSKKSGKPIKWMERLIQ
ncbi:ComGG family competence protein [Sporolactobacillus shoreicorticis]|uniref:Competence type IV pilus minor pilin ComGG n=1 Tax=Sporolactobacillus shoreicorticis TaxID=1923877 RepID=A0ABW5S832_9BACL|nr:competence type IV pilus minor pilin ComGG [Sporolactobacillus shoreicorticis]MCO7126832.1 ComGG family competence protein [Sporolactobacillus shoreicorticis]